MDILVRHSRSGPRHAPYTLSMVALPTMEERAVIDRHDLWDEVVYRSADWHAAQEQLTAAGADLDAIEDKGQELVRTIWHSLRVMSASAKVDRAYTLTLAGLVDGASFTSDNASDLMATERLVTEGLERITGRLDATQLFDGRAKLKPVGAAAKAKAGAKR